MKILVATKNQAKLKEISKYLTPELEAISLLDFPDAPDVDEVGDTFEENAIMKARIYFEHFRIPCVADDGGFEIDALHGEPGVWSRRWPTDEELSVGIPPREKTDQELIAMTLKKLESVPLERRTAHLRTVVAYYDGKTIGSASRSVDGIVPMVSAKKWDIGFPFRAIFLIPQFGKLYQDLSAEEHGLVNHRKAAIEELKKKILAS